MVVKEIGGITFTLGADFDCAFLTRIGEPFAVFDDQDSGNICFGVRAGGERLFIKVAGMTTKRGATTPDLAIERMRESCSVWRELRHPALLELLFDREIPGGYIQAFPWFDGECAGRQYPSHVKFAGLPVSEKMNIYDAIMDFHLHVAAKDYVAIDFYDGCILYDFGTRQTKLCDVEFYRKAPVVNERGRMWGSGRFMSPEEFTLGATIDQCSNVFCMGAAAFQLLGGGLDRSVETWRAAPELYAVARKAVSPEREERYATMAEYARAWRLCE